MSVGPGELAGIECWSLAEHCWKSASAEPIMPGGSRAAVIVNVLVFVPESGIRGRAAGAGAGCGEDAAAAGFSPRSAAQM